MQLSPLYLEKIQAAKQEGEIIGEERGRQAGESELVIRLLNRRVGGHSSELQVQVKALSLLRLGELGEALLDFTSIADLESWLSQDSRSNISSN